MIKVIVGFVAGVCALAVAEYLFITGGGIKMSNDASSLPMERFLAHTAITASIGKAAKDQSPVPADETNLLAGAEIYQTKGCAGCHGRIDDPKSGGGKTSIPPHRISCHHQRASPMMKSGKPTGW